MSEKPSSSLIWNAHVKQLLVEGQRVIAAFETLQFSLAEAQKPSLVGRVIGIDQEEPETAAVPVWALREIVERWSEYEGTQGSPSLGQVFGLEGSGRGKHKSMGRYRRLDAYVTDAYEVEQLINNGVSKTEAIDTIARERGIEPEALRKALTRPELPRTDCGKPSAE